MKKIGLILLLTLLIIPVARAAFVDVASGHENRIAIDYLQQEEIIGGYPDGTFRPDNPINRAEMMKILVEGQGVSPDINEFNNCFPDVLDEWFAPYVCYAKAQDWVGGYPDGTFQPANNVLNVEALKMILNAKGIELDPDYLTLAFVNVNRAEWYYPFAVTAEKLNLTTGFEPGLKYTRAEVSEVIFRTLVIEGSDSDVFSEDLLDDFLGLAQQEETGARYEDYTPEKLEQYKGSQPFALFFHASWCPICRQIEEDLKANLNSYPDGVLILEADYDTETALRQEYEVLRQYHFVIFDANGEVVFSNNLFSADQVIEEISKTL